MRSTIHFVLGRRGVVLLASAVLLFASPLAAQDSAAEALGVAGGVEQTILERLTPAQAEAFLAGADPATIVLEDGTSLEEFLLEGLIDTASNSVYHPLNQCLVVRTATGLGGGKYTANKKRDHTVRGTCGVPADATAVVLNAKVYAASGSGQVSVYPLGHSATPAVVNVRPGQAVNNMVTVALGSAGDFSVKPSVAVHAVLHTVGYFAPLVMGSGSSLDADTLDGLDSTDFATVAALGAHTGDTGNPHQATLEQLTPTTAKGDLLVEDGADVVALPVGADGQLLVADSAASSGVKWLTVAVSCPVCSAPALVPETGQTTSYGDRDDGELERGVAWPVPRFTDNGNGTVTDNLTGLIWLKNANCPNTARTWATALSDVAQLNTGGTMGNLFYPCGDTSNGGNHQTDWRLPNIRELQSLIDYGTSSPALPAGHGFAGVQLSLYWSSTTGVVDGIPTHAWFVDLGNGVSANGFNDIAIPFVWPVRGGQ